jgi:hypothetical protein
MSEGCNVNSKRQWMIDPDPYFSCLSGFGPYNGLGMGMPMPILQANLCLFFQWFTCGVFLQIAARVAFVSSLWVWMLLMYC